MKKERSTKGSWQGPGAFHTTQWSVVLDVRAYDSSQRERALEQLCSKYWSPLYAYARRVGHSAHDAEDLTQAFFGDVIARRAFEQADRSRGRFRSFVLSSFRNFMANVRAKETSQKRGGGKPMLSFDVRATEANFCSAPADTASPERLFDRDWALRLLEQSMQALEREYTLAEKGELFAALKSQIHGASDQINPAALAEKLQMTPGALKVALHRLRKRFGERLRQEVAETLHNPTDAEEELRHLLAALLP